MIALTKQDERKEALSLPGLNPRGFPRELMKLLIYLTIGLVALTNPVAMHVFKLVIH